MAEKRRRRETKNLSKSKLSSKPIRASIAVFELIHREGVFGETTVDVLDRLLLVDGKLPRRRWLAGDRVFTDPTEAVQFAAENKIDEVIPVREISQ